MVYICYLTLWRRRQKDSTLEASLGYMVNLLLKKFVLQNPQGLNHRHIWHEVNQSYFK